VNRLVRRAFQLSRTLPNQLLHTFQETTALLPRATEAERLVVQRIGQDLFRDGLLDYWEGQCAITGLCVRELLRASHIKPWAACPTDVERLDIFNGLLLAPHLDAAFDRGLLTFDPDGTALLSAQIPGDQWRRLGIQCPLRLRRMEPAHQLYVSWHRDRIFRSV
jgi:putative restriction endonuclease